MDKDDPLVKRRPTLNPYLFGMGVIARRLLWDVNPRSWTARHKLGKWKNKYRGEKAVILCNGPSLNKVDFDLVGSECFTFGLNKIDLLFDRSSFRPSCIVAVNSLVIEQNRDFYNETDIPLFLDSIATRSRWVNSRNNVAFLHSGGRQDGFARDCSMSINPGFTVTYVALQLAFHMGFSRVGLVGADHTFATKGPANKIADGESIDESHFDPRYFSNVKWQLPDLFESEVAYTRANNTYHAHDRKIFNCTEGGKLEVFDRLPLTEFLS